MSAIMNGIALHGGFNPYGATFLMFSEYARNALRMAALMKISPIFVYTHDSIGLGEDGPTHQPVEQTATLRMIPRMSVWRPCDAVETAVAWKVAVERKDGPTSLIFSRQGLPHMERTEEQMRAIAKGGYVLRGLRRHAGRDHHRHRFRGRSGGGRRNDLTGTRAARCAWCPCLRPTPSMPRTPPTGNPCCRAPCTARVAVEAGVTDLWRKYVGLHGKVIGVDTFGESAPAADVYKQFGITAENVVKAVEELL